MKCLYDTVGLRGLCESEGSIYINDLPGIEIETFSKSATKEDVTLKGYWERLQREGANQVCEDFLTKMSDIYQYNAIVESKVLGLHDYGKYIKYTELEDKLVGKEFYLNTGDPCINLRVDWVEIYSATEVKKILYIENEFEVTKQEVMIRKGINRIPLNLVGKWFRIFLSICDLQLVDSASCSCMAHQSCSSCSCSCVSSRDIHKDDCFDWAGSGKSYFSACVSCICDKEHLVCKFKNELRQAYRYKIAALLLEEVMSSDNVNPLIRNGKRDAGNAYARIMGGTDSITGFKYEGPKYWVSLGEAVKRIKNYSIKGKCWTCSGLSYTESM